MSTLIYTTRPDGRMISNGKLSILVLNDNLRDIRNDTYQNAVNLKDATDDTRIDPTVWQEEAERLCQLAERIVSPDSGLDIFAYLPLTKSGGFLINKKTLIADSKCGYGWSTYYPVSKKLQMRLVPAFTSEMDWIKNQPMKDTMILKIDEFDALKKQEPIFDATGTPHKIDTTRASYIADAEILPGRIYEEKSGAQYLCITGCRFNASCIEFNGKIKSEPDWILKYCKPGENTYIKWTNVLAKAVGQDTSFNNIMRVMAAKDKSSHIGERLSRREHPRKFVREVAVLFDPKDIRPEKILGAKYTVPYTPITYQFEYEIFAPLSEL